MDTPNAKMRRRRDRPFRDFDALRTSSRQGGSSVGASVPMMSVETATSAPEVDVAAPGPFDLGRDRVSGPCLGLVLRTVRPAPHGLDRVRCDTIITNKNRKVREQASPWRPLHGPKRGPFSSPFSRREVLPKAKRFRRTRERSNVHSMATSPAPCASDSPWSPYSPAGHVSTRHFRAVTATPSDP